MRLEDAQPTRLGIDATTDAGWRNLGFYPVIGGARTDTGASTLSKLLALGRANPPKTNAPLSKDVSLDLQRQLSCPNPSELGTYIRANPHGGMPYATAPLADADYRLLADWAKTGTPLPERTRELPSAISSRVLQLESFLNAPSKRRRLVARYIYEHLFLAHLHIEGDDDAHFFRIIRSRTPVGQLPAEVPTRRPFDDPGQEPFYYRLVPLIDTVLHKEHIVYEIGPKRIARYQELFLDPQWGIDRLPGYSNQAGGNPFTTFAAIPAKARYQFLLDDALFFVRSFIRGPVCYGQVAVNVIEDRFWVAFLDPAADLSVNDQEYLEAMSPALEIPILQSDGGILERLFSFSLSESMRYLRARDAAYSAEAARSGGATYASVWDGEGGKNRGGLLTIYRNFDSASVVTGFVGAIPKNAWIIDFPLFERLYYNLVAAFDIFGNLEHQLTTRMYMDSLRREGEVNFLYFLPRELRKGYFDSWYRGTFSRLSEWLETTPINSKLPTKIAFQTQDAKAEFLETLVRRGRGAWPIYDPINRCQLDSCAKAATTEGKLRRLVGGAAPWTKYFPDVAVLVVEGDQGDNKVFTLVSDKSHLNVAFIFLEEERRVPALDKLTIVPGQLTSYPNFFFKVQADRLAEFVDQVLEVRTQTDYIQLVAKHGIRRSSPEFWSVFDMVQAQLVKQDAREAGLLDLNRYKDPKVGDTVE